MIILVTYDLNVPGKDYTKLYRGLELISQDYIRPLKSVWLFYTTSKPEDVWDKLSRYIDGSDRMLVTVMKPGYYGWLDKEHWSWIDARVGN